MSIEERNKQVIRALLESTDRGDFKLIRQHYHDNFIEHNTSSAVHSYEGRKGVEIAFHMLQRIFPKRQHIIEDMIAEGDKVAARITFIATPAETLNSVLLQKREFKVTGTVIYRLQEFQIIEKWTQVSVLKELGISLNDIKNLSYDRDQTDDIS